MKAIKIDITKKQAKEVLWLLKRTESDWTNLYLSMSPEENYELNLRKDSILKFIQKLKKMVE